MADYGQKFAEGLNLAGQAKWDEALAAFAAAAQAQPHPDALSNVGFCLRKLGRWDEAEAQYRKVLDAHPGHAGTLVNYGCLLNDWGRPEEANSVLERAHHANPADTGALVNWSNTLAQLGRMDDAEKVLRHLLARNPDSAEGHRNLSNVLLVKGALREGFAEYEWRLRFPDVIMALRPEQLHQPRWDGSQSLEGKTLLAVTEQGLGDTLNFVRYGALVKKAGGRMILTCGDGLVRVMENCEVLDGLVKSGSPMAAYDYHVPLLSLPHIFGTDLDNVPAQVPYLHARPEWIEAWAPALGPRRGPRVGLVWAGSPGHKNDRNRSLDITQLEPLLATAQQAGIETFSLQVGGRDGDAAFLDSHPELRRLPAFTDWADTAAVVAQLDLVICVDTSIAHLTGAMGKPVWVMLPFNPDWRWLLHRPDTPWYPTMRLFRQKRIGSYDEVLEDIRAALGALPGLF